MNHHQRPHSFHVPADDNCEERGHQRDRAAAYLSTWIKHNSFHVGSSGSESDDIDSVSTHTSSSDDSDNASVDSSISSVSTSLHSREEDDLGISVGLSISDDLHLEVFEDDNFNASNISNMQQSNAQQSDNSSQQSDTRSRSFYAPRQTSFQRGKQEGRKRSNSAEYLPGALRMPSHNHVAQSDRPQKVPPPQPPPPPQPRSSSKKPPPSSSSSANVTIVASASGNIVYRLPWRDHRGIAGHFTGHINDDMQPHGAGALVYKDGSAETSIWENGIPVEFWTPEMKKIVPEVQFKKGKQKKKKKKKPQVAPSYSLDQTSFNSSSTGSSINTYLPHLDLGEVGSPQDMNAGNSDPEKIGSLQMHDFAFILRSDNQWTYAIIADKQEDTIRFVVDNDGSSKIISKKNWSAGIRLVNLHSKLKKKKKKKKRRSDIRRLSNLYESLNSSSTVS